MRQILIFIGLSILISCEKPSDCTTQYFSETYKSYLLYNEGSYWEYADTFKNIIDTIKLVNQIKSFDDECSVQSPPHETLKQEFTSSFFMGDNQYQWTALGASSPYYYNGGEITGQFSEDNCIAIDSMLINEIWYKNILDYSTENNRYYWAEEIGVIKKIAKT